MSQLSQTLSETQSHLQTVIGEVDIARVEKLNISYTLSEELSALRSELQEKSSCAEEAAQRVVELEQNLTTWKTAAEEKEGAQSDLLRTISEMESSTQQQREALQEKVAFLEKQVHEKDSSSADIYTRMEVLEATIRDRDAALTQKQAELLQVQTEQQELVQKHAQTGTELQQELHARDQKLNDMQLEIQKIEQLAAEDKDAAIQEVQGHLDKRTADLEAANKKFGQLREEAKSRIKDLKARMEETNIQLEDKDKQIAAKETEMQMRVQTLLEELELEKADIKKENQASINMLTQQLEQEKEALTTYKENMEKQQGEQQERMKDTLNTLKVEFEETLKQKEDTFNNRLKEVEEAKENDKGRREEDKITYEHRKETEELLQDLHEKDQKMEELIDEKEVQLQAKDEMHKAEVEDKCRELSELETLRAEQEQAFHTERATMEADIRAQITKQFESRELLHQEELEGLSNEWKMERLSTASASDDSQPKDLVHQNQLTLNAIQSSSSSSELLRHHVIQLTKQVEELKVRHKLEIAEVRSGRDMARSGLPKPLLGGGDVDAQEEQGEVQQLELENLDLQTHLIQQSGDLAKLKFSERELKQQVESLQQRLRQGQGPGSPYQNSTGGPQGPLLTEPTEMEYLKNILYEYMMGKETKTLSRVIATVLRFSDEQTRRIIEQEENRNSQL